MQSQSVIIYASSKMLSRRTCFRGERFFLRRKRNKQNISKGNEVYVLSYNLSKICLNLESKQVQQTNKQTNSELCLAIHLGSSLQ